MSKTALAISGGGSKGAFAVGVLKYIKQNKPEISFDIFCGTSTGSLITPLAVLAEISELERVYTSTTTKDILLKGRLIDRFINDDALFDVTPLVNLVKKTITDSRYNSIMNSGKDFFLATVCLQTGKITYFTNTSLASTPEFDMIKISNKDELVRAIVASSNQPVFMSPVEIRGKQYVDGGVREYAPIQAAIADDATDIYAILLSPEIPNNDGRKFESLTDILLRSISLFSEDVSANDVRISKLFGDGIAYINSVKQKILDTTDLTEEEVEAFFFSKKNPFQNKKELNIHIIRPDAYLGTDGLSFEPAQMKGMLDKGYATAETYFKNLPA